MLITAVILRNPVKNCFGWVGVRNLSFLFRSKHLLNPSRNSLCMEVRRKLHRNSDQIIFTLSIANSYSPHAPARDYRRIKTTDTTKRRCRINSGRVAPRETSRAHLKNATINSIWLSRPAMDAREMMGDGDVGGGGGNANNDKFIKLTLPALLPARP